MSTKVPSLTDLYESDWSRGHQDWDLQIGWIIIKRCDRLARREPIFVNFGVAMCIVDVGLRERAAALASEVSSHCLSQIFEIWSASVFLSRQIQSAVSLMLNIVAVSQIVNSKLLVFGVLLPKLLMPNLALSESKMSKKVEFLLAIPTVRSSLRTVKFFSMCGGQTYHARG